MKRSVGAHLRRLAPAVERREQVRHVRGDAALGVTFARLAPGEALEQIRLAHDPRLELVLRHEAGQKLRRRRRGRDRPWSRETPSWLACLGGSLDPLEDPVAAGLACEHDARASPPAPTAMKCARSSSTPGWSSTSTR